LLASYRQAVAISGPGPVNAAETERIETRFYKMNADTARDMLTVLPRFVRPGTWQGEYKGNESDRIGTITTVAIDPTFETTPSDNQSDAHIIPQAVLIIKHTKSAHREIDQFLWKIKQGDPQRPGGFGGFGGGLGGLGAAGGAFF
jgi:hypothetical protein